MQGVDAKMSNKVKSQIKNKTNVKDKSKAEAPTNNENIEQQEADMNPKNDDISTSSTDDMFAFSQVIASGGNVQKTIEAIETEEKQRVIDEEKAREVSAWKYAMD